VVKVALSHNIDIVFAEGNGAAIGRVWHSKLGSTTKIRKRQLEASLGEEAVFWIKQWISDKINNQADFTKDLKRHRKAKENEINELLDKLHELANEFTKYGDKLLLLDEIHKYERWPRELKACMAAGSGGN